MVDSDSVLAAEEYVVLSISLDLWQDFSMPLVFLFEGNSLWDDTCKSLGVWESGPQSPIVCWICLNLWHEVFMNTKDAPTNYSGNCCSNFFGLQRP